MILVLTILYIVIKLLGLHSFDELSRFSNDLKKGIEIPVINESNNGKIEILAGNKGLVVLFVAVGIGLAIRLIASINVLVSSQCNYFDFVAIQNLTLMPPLTTKPSTGA
jgi:hypothetical protein